MPKSNENLESWLFKALMFEAEAQTFRDAGFRVGADTSSTEQFLTEETLSPFSVSLRNEALRMSRLYALIFCFENSVRALIKERLQDKFGPDWWSQVPSKVRNLAESRRKEAENNSWLDFSNADLLSFAEFGNLSDIIGNNWDSFSDLIPSQHWIKQRMDELEKTRNFIAHNRMLVDTEFQRIEMYIADWNRQVGL